MEKQEIAAADYRYTHIDDAQDRAHLCEQHDSQALKRDAYVREKISDVAGWRNVPTIQLPRCAVCAFLAGSVAEHAAIRDVVSFA